MSLAVFEALRRLESSIQAEMVALRRNHPEFLAAARRGDQRAVSSELENYVFQGGRGNGDWRFGVALAQASLEAEQRGLEDAAEWLRFQAIEVLRYMPEARTAELLTALRGAAPAIWVMEPGLEFAIKPHADGPPPDWNERIDADPEAAILEMLAYLGRHPQEQLDAEVQRALAELRDRGVASQAVFEQALDLAVDGASNGVTFQLSEYAGWCAERDVKMRRYVVLSFAQKRYDRFQCWRAPSPAPESFNDWEYQGWAVGDEDWPLAALAWKWLPEERLQELLDQPVTGEPERSLHYLILRRWWRSGGENFARLEAIARLVERVEGAAEMAPLFERAMLVFDQQWRALGMEWRKQEAARVFQVIAEIGRAAGLPPLDGGTSEGPDDRPPELPPPDPFADLPPVARQRAHRLRSLRQRLAHHPDDAQAWLDLGELHHETGDLEDAIGAFTELTIRAPLFAVAHYRLGKIRMTQKRYAQARHDFSNAILLFEERGGIERYLELEKPPDTYVDSYRTRGVAWCHEGEYTRGLDDVSTAMRLRRDDARLVWERGYLREKAALRDLAVEDYLHAGLLHLDSGDAAKAKECADALERLGAREQAAQLRPGRSAPESDLP
ncbi:MAG: tetratricopeptide repeat protein [Bryobacteraceae bacterium]